MSVKKPEWLRKRLPTGSQTQKVEHDLSLNRLHTICQEGCCPNQGECFARGTATFLAMGNVCTRNCRFCAVTSGRPGPLDEHEPKRIAEEVIRLGLRYVVVTSVTRDDLDDGGAAHFARIIEEIMEKCPGVGIEVLIPDFKGSKEALQTVVDARPSVLNHNVETIPILYPCVRPQADFGRSVELLRRVKTMNPTMVTKSGMMLGLGEKESDVKNVMKELRDAGCDILTIGQYLRPSENHHPVVEYVEPHKYDEYKATALELGFIDVAAGPFVRSSYKALDSYINAVKYRKDY